MRLCLGRPLALSVVVSAGFGIAASAQQAIDRRALVDRHAPVLRGFDTGSPLSVGNGEFAFTVDATGLQTFAEAYDEGVPLGTLSQWAWHTDPNPNGYSIDRFRLTPFESHGRQIPYADAPGDQRTPEVEWLRRNPHRLHLGRIGFLLRLKDGREATAEDVKDVEQRLELWDGTLLTRFRLDGEEVMVETLCHPTRDAIGVRVVSPLVGRGQIGIRLRFPYGSGEKTAADWTRPQAHQTKLVRSTSRNALFERELDHDRYRVSLAWSVEGRLKRSAEHDYLLTPETKGDTLDLLVGFSPGVPARMLPPYEEVRRLARESWNKFWSLGGAVDLSGSRDPRAARARAPHRALAVPDRDPVRGHATRRRRRGSRSTAGTASSTSRCTGGTPRISRSGAARAARAQPRAGTTRILPRAQANGGQRRATRAPAGRR